MLCERRSSRCQEELERYQVNYCGQHHSVDNAERWIVEREGTCKSCAYPSHPIVSRRISLWRGALGEVAKRGFRLKFQGLISPYSIAGTPTLETETRRCQVPRYKTSCREDTIFAATCDYHRPAKQRVPITTSTGHGDWNRSAAPRAYGRRWMEVFRPNR